MVASIEEFQSLNYKDIIIQRLKTTKKANRDRSFQRLLKELCRRDVVFFCENFVWTYDPRSKPTLIPMMLFPIQEQYLRWRRQRRDNAENGVIEKSRDMGFSTLNVIDHIHCWLFEDGFKGTFSSRKESLVDKIGNPDSIFEKIRMILRYLPTWMLPKGFNWKLHDTFCKIINPETGATITGEAGDNAGRGGRSTVYDLDEFGFYDRAAKVDAAVSANSNTIFYTSTANGVGNQFYKKRFSGSIPVFTARWTEDPRKNQAWYDKQCATLDPIIRAQEIDLDYGAAVEGIMIPNLHVQSCVNRALKPSGGEIVASLDVAYKGSCSTVFGQRQGNRVFNIQSWKGLDPVQSAFKVVEIYHSLPASEKFSVFVCDADGMGEGVVGTLATIPRLPFRVLAFHGAGSASDRYWEAEERTSKEKFANARAEIWYLAKEYIRRTYESANGIREYEDSEQISLPNCAELIAQLSVPLRKFSERGKWLVESKLDMEKRGVASPDFADMLAYLFADTSFEEDASWIGQS